MNRFIKEQLDKCRVQLPKYDDSTTHLYIPRDTPVEEIQEKKPEKIYIMGYVINEPPSFNLSEQWNNNTVPPENVMEVTVIETRGKMIKVKGKGVTTGEEWCGWLPQKGFKYI